MRNTTTAALPPGTTSGRPQPTPLPPPPSSAAATPTGTITPHHHNSRCLHRHQHHRRTPAAKTAAPSHHNTNRRSLKIAINMQHIKDDTTCRAGHGIGFHYCNRDRMLGRPLQKLLSSNISSMCYSKQVYPEHLCHLWGGLYEGLDWLSNNIANKNDIPVFYPGLTDGSLRDMLLLHSFCNTGLVVDINRNNKKSIGRDSKGGIIILPPVSFEEHVAVQRETKARTLLLQSLLEDHMADFHHLDDAREIRLAVKARFGDNKESKKMRKTMHEAQNKTEEGEQVYGLMARIKSDFADHAGNAAGSVYDAAAEFGMMGISLKEWEVKLKESLARFDKRKESSKTLTKLINSSVSSRTKLGLGFKESIGSDEVFDLSTPSVFDPKPKNREVKSLYERFVKAGEMHEVPPSITGSFMPTSYKSNLEETQVTFGSKSNTSESNDFVSCDNSDKSSELETYDFASCVSNPKTNDSFSTVDVKILPKSDVKDPSPTNGFPSCSFKKNVKPPRNLCNKSGITDRIHCKNNFVRTKTCFVCGSKSLLIKDCDVYDNVDNFPYVVLKAASVPAGSRNSSASTSAGRSIPAASRNKPASIHAGRHIPAGKFNKPAPFPAGRSVPTGWTNHAAIPLFRPTDLYFDNLTMVNNQERVDSPRGYGSGVYIKSVDGFQMDRTSADTFSSINKKYSQKRAKEDDSGIDLMESNAVASPATHKAAWVYCTNYIYLRHTCHDNVVVMKAFPFWSNLLKF
nr:xylulose kinase-1 [Tanacetum cinerariifolium]